MWNSLEKPDWELLKKSQPFFQVINIGASHESSAFGDVYNTEHNPAKTILRSYHPDVPGMRENYAHYYDAIKKMDREVGMHINKVKEMGLADNTIIIYTSDHGGVLPRSKRFLFKNSIHCPLIMHIPNQFKRLWPANHVGSKIDRLVSFVDMPKTWLSITNSQIPAHFQGTIFLGDNIEPEQSHHFSFRGRADERIENARAISNKRFLYIRNYMPYVPWMQRIEYLWRMTATQVWEDAVKNNNTTKIQSQYFNPKVRTEELYDIENDPDCVNNLAGLSTHKNELHDLRKALREKQIKFYDAGLIPEKEMNKYAAENNLTIYELVRKPELYDVVPILDAANIALEKAPKNLPKLIEFSSSKNIAIRYWGMVGCFLLNDTHTAEQLLEDKAHSIRQLAAWTLIKSGNKERGIEVLKKMIEQNSYDIISLFNVVLWLGEDGKELIPSVNNVNLTSKNTPEKKYLERLREYINLLHG